MFCGAPVSFGVVIRTLIAQSTVETELVVVSYSSKKAEHISSFLTELGSVDLFASVPINCDRQRALHVTGNWTYSSRTKYIALRFSHLWEIFKHRCITIHHVSTIEMQTGICTKWLSALLLREIFIHTNGVVNLTSDNDYFVYVP